MFMVLDLSASMSVSALSLVCSLSTEWIDEFWPNLHVLIATKLANIYLKDNSKSLLCFFDLYLIFKVKSQLINVKFPLKMRYFFNQLMDIHQTCMNLSS